MAVVTYYRSEVAGIIAIFAPAAGARRIFPTEGSYQAWRRELMADPVPQFIPPANPADITTLPEPAWAIVCALYGLTPDLEEIP